VIFRNEILTLKGLKFHHTDSKLKLKK